jgi:hypothetical protein
MKRIPILFVLWLLMACHKDKDEANYTLDGSYKSDFSVSYDAAVLYTANGKITDTNIVKSFAKKYDFLWYAPLRSDGANFMTGGYIAEAYGSFRLDITHDSVRYYTISYADNIATEKSPRTLSRLSNNKFLMKDSQLSYIQSANDGQFSCTNAFRYMRQNPPSYNCVASNCTGYEQVPLTAHDGYITYPFYFYYLAKKVDYLDGINFCTSSNNSGTADDFNESVINKFRAGDTLLLIRYYRTLYKQ